MWGLGRRGGGCRRVPRLRKECSFTILLASTWTLIRGEGRQRREYHEQNYGLRMGGLDYWASALSCHSFQGVYTLINK